MNTWKSQMIERLVRITKIGFRIGKMMSRNRANRAGAVDLGGLEQFARDLGQPGEDGDRDERDRTPDDQRGDHAEADERCSRTSRSWMKLPNAELRQRVVDDAVLVVRHPEPDLAGDDDRHRPGEHERRR